MKRLLIFLMLTVLLNLSGCSKSAKNSSENNISASVKAFNERTIHNKLSVAILDTIPDDRLLQVLFDNLSGKIADYHKEYETVTSWNKSQQAIYLIWVLEGEVNNGGYNQYYFNQGNDLYKFAPDALRLVGAHKYASLTQRANDIYEAQNEKITQHQDGTIEGFSKSYENNPLNEFDDAFYALSEEENLAQLQTDYIRKHKQDFVSD